MKKALLLFASIPMMLASCTGGTKVSNNFFEINLKSLARQQESAVNLRLSDPNYDYKYSVKFKLDMPKDCISLGGGLVGKSIDAIAVSEDLHSVVLVISGNSQDASATEGTVTISPAAYEALNAEYEGFTFVNTIPLGEKTEYKGIF